MHIASIKTKNFRLIQNADLDLSDSKQDISLLIGRNNTGKTSFIVLLEKFLNSASPNFSFDDFPIKLRSKILNFDEDTDVYEIAISLLLDIHYDEADSLANISDFILDLDPDLKSVKILFECTIDKNKFIDALSKIKDREDEYIKKYIGDFLETNIYTLSDYDVIEPENRHKQEYFHKLVKKDWKYVNNLINLQVIHAKRDVASSESNQRARKVLSGLTTDYYNKKNKLSYDEQCDINKSIVEIDANLDASYEKYFKKFLETSKDFLQLKDLKVVSDLQSKEILASHSKVVYGDNTSQLPEHLNGLGYMNILYLLLQIEIKKNYFAEGQKDINLLIIEEPEAHTHPQMQYVFIDKIKGVLQGITNLQSIITSHSSHIVNRCDFKTLRYFLKSSDGDSVTIKNFYNELSKLYSSDNLHENEAEKANFKFLQQYLTLNSSELFFAEKIIFIEGTTEKLLLPLFINNVDDENLTSLSSQNISVLEVGANAKAFRHFIEFLQIKTLIITDIDTTQKTVKSKQDKPAKKDITYRASSVIEGDNTSNYSIKYFLNAPELDDAVKHNEWMCKLIKNQLHDADSTIKVAYQIEESGYHGRSFEDAFISANFDKIKSQKDNLDGLKNKNKLNASAPDFYKLTKEILEEKSDFASSLLWLALSDGVKWNIPAYIREGLLWMAAK